MKIWFDADNGPHVLIMRPLVAELERRGHEVVFTARDRTKTCQLLDMYGFSYRKVGGEYGRGMSGKVRGTLGRAGELVRDDDVLDMTDNAGADGLMLLLYRPTGAGIEEVAQLEVSLPVSSAP